VVRSDGVILGESLVSQNEIHRKWGGVVPNLAKNAHEQTIERVVHEAIIKSGMKSVKDVDVIGVTVGPGLEVCLRVGCDHAKHLAIIHSKPFVGIHHLEAHILMTRLPCHGNDKENMVLLGRNEKFHESLGTIEFPFLALLVSGGHSQIIICFGVGRYHIIGGTIDDSLGKK